MKKNVGSTDKIIRYLIATVICILYLTNVITGTLSIVLVIFAAVMILTSLFSFCPLYALLGLTSKKAKE